MDTGDVICGPSLTVDHLLAQCKCESIRELVDEKMKGDISAHPPTVCWLFLIEFLCVSHCTLGVEQAEGKPLYLTFAADLPQRMALSYALLASVFPASASILEGSRDVQVAASGPPAHQERGSSTAGHLRQRALPLLRPAQGSARTQRVALLHFVTLRVLM
jgi:hypothetical protein